MKKEMWIFSSLLVIGFIFDSEILNFIKLLRFDSMTTLMLYVSSVLTFIIVLGFYSGLLKDKKKILLLGVTVVLSYLLSLALKFIIMRKRPDVALFFEYGYGFPSSHATSIFSTVVLMNREFPKLKWGFILVAVLISFSRIYLGVHYLSDLIAGAFLGIGVGLFVLDWKKFLAKFKSLK